VLYNGFREMKYMAKEFFSMDLYIIKSALSSGKTIYL